MSYHQKRIRYVVERNSNSRIPWIPKVQKALPQCCNLMGGVLSIMAILHTPDKIHPEPCYYQSPTALVNMNNDTIKVKLDTIEGDHEIKYHT